MVIAEYEQYLIKKPEKPRSLPPSNQEEKEEVDSMKQYLADLQQYRIEKPKQRRTPTPTAPKQQQDITDLQQYRIPGPERVRLKLQPVSALEDVAKQAVITPARAALSAPGNLLSLVDRGVGYVANKLGDTAKEAYNLSRKFMQGGLFPKNILPKNITDTLVGGYPTTQTINELGKEIGINLEPQTPAGRVTERVIDPVVSSLALGTPTAAAPAIALGGGTGQVLREVGAPEWAATGADVLIGLNPYQIAKDVISRRSSSAGMPLRRFRNTKQSRAVSANTKDIITQNVEMDFKETANQILSKSRNYQELKNNPAFQEELDQAFAKLETLVAEIPETVSTKDIQTQFNKSISEGNYKGYADSEFERALKSNVNRVNKAFQVREIKPKVQLLDAQGNPIKSAPKTVGRDLSVDTVVEQYRKNNRQLKQYFEPGKSGAFNLAKKTVLLEENKAITAALKKKFPKSEFVEVFEQTNRDYERLMQFEYVDDKLGGLFGENKINFTDAKKLLSNTPFQRNLKGLVGEGVQQQFNGLLRDFISIQDPYKLLRVAQNSGLATELVKYAAPYLFGKEVGITATALKVGGIGVKTLREKMLQNPEIIFNWREGLKNFKAGQYPAAIRSFQEVERLTREDQGGNR